MGKHLPFLQAWGAAHFPVYGKISEDTTGRKTMSECRTTHISTLLASRTLMVQTDLNCPVQPYQRPLLAQDSLSAQCWALSLGLSSSGGWLVSKPCLSPPLSGDPLDPYCNFAYSPSSCLSPPAPPQSGPMDGSCSGPPPHSGLSIDPFVYT